jgi:HK97 family phage major capsid protein
MKRYGHFAVGLLAIIAIATVAVLGFDIHPAAAALQPSGHLPLYGAEFGALAGVPTELKAVFDRIGEAFNEFKKAHEEEIKGVKKGFDDVITKDKLKKVEDALDAGIETQTKFDAALKAEAKEREELELKLGRMNLSGHSEESARREVEIKSFNDQLAGLNAGRNRAFTPLDGAGYDAYKSAQDHYLREGKDNLTADEVKTMSVGSDPDGGYFVTPDTSGRIVKKVYETSAVRQEASIITISTDALEGIEDLGEAGAGYAGETAQGSDTTTPQVGKWRIQPYWIDTEPKTTQQLLDDAAVNVEAWLSDKVANKFSRFENAEFVTGAANKIRGFMLGYTPATDSGSGVTWGTVGFMGTGASADFAASNPVNNLHDIIGLLKNDYLPNAKFFTRRSVITKIRKFKDSTGQSIWMPPSGAGYTETIMGYPIVRMEDISALAANSFSLAFGDLRQAYQIVDRSGIRVLRDPFTSKPYIKFYTTKRTGGGLVNFEAIKLLKFI